MKIFLTWLVPLPCFAHVRMHVLVEGVYYFSQTEFQSGYYLNVGTIWCVGFNQTELNAVSIWTWVLFDVGVLIEEIRYITLRGHDCIKQNYSHVHCCQDELRIVFQRQGKYLVQVFHASPQDHRNIQHERNQKTILSSLKSCNHMCVLKTQCK